jgi:FtsH-binding integral membrane protein
MNYASRSPRDPRSAAAAVDRLGVAGTTAVTDAIWKTYRWMTLGLALTGLVALGVASSSDALELIVGNRIVFYGLLFAQLGLVLSFTAAARRASTPVVAAMFFAYAALTGATFSVLFLVYTASSIAGVFFVTAGAFAGLSAVGYFTKRDLSAVGRFAIFALIGIIIASVVNFFLQSSGLQWIVSIVGVLLFGALTAYDTQKMKEIYASGEVSGNMPLVLALTLYLDFVNMFLFLLRIFGRRRS